MKTLNLPFFGAIGCVHPDMLYFPDRRDGYRYWLYYSRYPYEKQEAPCLVRSNDGINFVDTGVKNPLITRDDEGARPWERDHIADQDIIKDGKRFWMFYSGCYSNKPIGDRTPETVEEKNMGNTFPCIADALSFDGINWERLGYCPVISGGVEPTVTIKDKEYYMVFSRRRAKLNIEKNLLLTKSRDMLHWSKPVEILKPVKPYILLGHPDIILHNGLFELYYMAYKTRPIPRFKDQWWVDIYMATSEDGFNWKNEGIVIPNHADYMPYRTTVFYENDRKRIYFSYVNKVKETGKTHRIGVWK